MNKIIISVAAVMAVLGVVFAQVPGGFPGGQEGPRPQGAGQTRTGGGSSVAAAGNYVYVVSGNNLFQFSVDGLKLVAKTTILQLKDKGEVELMVLLVEIDRITNLQLSNKKDPLNRGSFFYFPLLPLLFTIGLNPADVAFDFEFSLNGVASFSSLGF